MSKKIAIADCKSIGLKTDHTHVVVFAYDEKDGGESVATWGQSIENCKEAADIGNKIKKGLGWPENMCHTKPRRAEKEKVCKHEFVHYKTDSYCQSVGYRSLRCVVTDSFHCQHCVEVKEEKKDKTFNQNERENLPDWAKVITNRVENHESVYRY